MIPDQSQPPSRAPVAPPARQRPTATPRKTRIWSYFLRGGGNDDDRVRRINSEFGDPLKGSAELFDCCRRAVEMGAGGIYLQNPGGCDRPRSQPPPMYANQFLRSAAVFGPAWVEDFTKQLTQFTREYPAVPVLCYCGGVYGPGFDFTPREQFIGFADTCYSPILGIPNVEIGYDASGDNAAGSVQDEVIDRNDEHGHPGWKEPHCLAHRPHSARRNCIVTSTEFYKHLRTWGIPAPGTRVIRILDIDPPTNRLKRIAEFLAECAAYGHEPAVPFHLHGMGRTPVSLAPIMREAASLRMTPYRRELVLKPA